MNDHLIRELKSGKPVSFMKPAFLFPVNATMLQNPT